MSFRKRALLLSLLLILVAGCVSLATQQMAANLSQAILNQDDPATVRAGAPAYLLLLDGLIEGDAKNPALLLAGAKLYSAYTLAFVEDTERAQRLTAKALTYARRALCLRRPQICAPEQQSFKTFTASLVDLKRADLEVLYAYAAAWAAWLQVHSDDWNALADLPKVEALLERVIVLDPAYQQGQPHLYLAIMRSQVPPSLGGHPELGRRHFEQAIALSQGANLAAKVAYAKYYARLVFDRNLHDRLLNEVLAADPYEPGTTLSNVLAQQEARQLLETADDYFPE